MLDHTAPDAFLSGPLVQCTLAHIHSSGVLKLVGLDLSPSIMFGLFLECIFWLFSPLLLQINFQMFFSS